jgi:hypothetical protein
MQGCSLVLWGVGDQLFDQDLKLERKGRQVSVRMAEAKVQRERVTAVQAAANKMSTPPS